MPSGSLLSSPGKNISLCGQGTFNCIALIDSCTSLIGLPGSVYDALYKQTPIGSIRSDCSNLDAMPTLEFTLSSGQKLSLGPESYVMTITEKTALSLSHYASMDFRKSNLHGNVTNKWGRRIFAGKHGHAIRVSKSKTPFSFTQLSESYCVTAFMESDMFGVDMEEEYHVGMVILGIPLFREYTVKFDRANGSIGF